MLLWRVVKSAQRRTAISTWKRIPHHVVKMTIGNGVFYLFFDWSIKSRVAYMRVLQSEWIPNSCEWPRTSIGGRQRKQKRDVNRMADVAHKMLGRKQWHGICVLPPKTFGRIFLFLLCSFFLVVVAIHSTHSSHSHLFLFVSTDARMTALILRQERCSTFCSIWPGTLSIDCYVRNCRCCCLDLHLQSFYIYSLVVFVAKMWRNTHKHC